MFYIVKKIAMGIACYVDICAIWAWVIALGADNITAIATAFIAVCALGVTVWQGWQNYKHNKLSVKPLLRFEESHQEAVEPIHKKTKGFFHYKFMISNYGVGPAVIKKFVLFSDGDKNRYDDFEKYNNFLNGMMVDFPYSNTNYLSDSGVVISGKKEMLWEFVYDFNNPAHHQKFEEMRKLCMYIAYQSIYEDEIIPLGFGFDNEIDDKEPA
ncbi:MAG: hypothetical protein K8953_05865 [Proteobacteria bacterium]|nr:hypothetical protein [Pseudomonadota bacterium]